MSGQVAIQYKEFGVRLTFRPTIAGDVIRLKVKPEVSSLDFANGVSISGIRVPALTTRRAETDVELRDGQSFAIAGLMNNALGETREGIPLLSTIPIIGNLFKSRADEPRSHRTADPRDAAPGESRSTPTKYRHCRRCPSKFLPPCDKPPCDGSAPPKKGPGQQ